MENIISLQDFYCFIEKNALVFEKDHDIIEAFLKYKNNTNSEEEKQLLQWEIEVFLFSFNGGKIFSFSTSNGNETGKLTEYPSLDAIQSNAFDYIKDRATKSTSSLLKARYNHILWESIHSKNRAYAISAAENYIQTIYDCCSQSDSEDYSQLLGELFENLAAITLSASVDTTQLKQLTSYLLFEAKGLSFWVKYGIIDDMLKYSKIFKADDFKNVLSLAPCSCPAV
ncbi:MAG: hypothetical protein NVV82_26340 [Sporocytophaga sp.]|nr:hypothetical protein [Sporocytophaga sp.]